MRFSVNEGVWVRLIDVGAALSRVGTTTARSSSRSKTPSYLRNAGRWRVTPSGAERTDGAADLRLDVTALGSVYLGGFTFRELVYGSRAEELTRAPPGAPTGCSTPTYKPWCAENLLTTVQGLLRV